jgi:uncharacterized membrane protein
MNRTGAAASSVFGRPAWRATLFAFALGFLVAAVLVVLIGIVAHFLSYRRRLSWQ